MKKIHVLAFFAAASLVGGCGLVDDIKGALSTLKAAASGDLSATSTALEGSNTAVQSAFDEVGASLDAAGDGGSGKRALFSGKAGLMPLQSGGDLVFKDTVEVDCDLGGSISRTIDIDIRRTTGKGTASIETVADNCKLDLNEFQETLGINSIQVNASTTDVTISGFGFGTPATDESNDDAYAVVLTIVGSDDAVEYVPSSSDVTKWNDSEIKIRIRDAALYDQEVEIEVYADNEGSNIVTVDLGTSATTNAQKSSLQVAQDSSGSTALLDGSQTVDLDIDLEFGETGEPQPTAINSIGYSAPDWRQEVFDNGQTESLLKYTNFSLVGEVLESGKLELTMDGAMHVDREPVSFAAAYDDLVITLAQDGLMASLLDDEDAEDDGTTESTIDGKVALLVSIDGNACIESVLTFETTTPLVKSDAACFDSGVVTINKTTDDGNTKVTYTFEGNGNVTFTGTDGSETVPCTALGGPGAGCLSALAK